MSCFERQIAHLHEVECLLYLIRSINRDNIFAFDDNCVFIANSIERSGRIDGCFVTNIDRDIFRLCAVKSKAS